MDRRQSEIEKLALEYEKQCLKDLQKAYTEALADVKRNLKGLLASEQTQSIVYQVQYQENLQKQIETALARLKSGSLTSVSDFLNKTYEDGYLGTIYSIQGQGIPINIGIDHEQMARTISRKTDTMQFSQRLYDNVDRLGVAFKSQMSRGIANNSTYSKIAKQLALESEANYKQAMRIVRTEGGRVKSEAKLNSMKAAKDEGADIVKQWDATFDGKTRPEHRYLDGQIKEIGEPFVDSQGREAQAPHKFGVASMDINCRCIVVERARWAVEGEEMPNKVDSRGELVEAKNYKEWKQKYQRKQAEQQKAELPNNAKVFDKNSKSLPNKDDYFKLPNNELVKIVEVNDYNGIKSVTLENGQNIVLGNVEDSQFKLQQTLKKAEEEKKALNYEVATIIDKKGNVIDTVGGKAHQVTISDELIERSKDAIFTHNHPSGLCFSRQDIESFVDIDLFELRASTPQGTYFSLKKNIDYPNSEAFIKLFKEEIGYYDRGYVLLEKMLDSGQIKYEEYEKKGFLLLSELLSSDMEDWLTKNAEKFGYIFTKGDI